MAVSTYGIAMCCDEQFARGAEAFLWSLLRYNRWFGGRVIVFDGGLSPSSHEALRRLYPVELVGPDPRLQAAGAAMVRTRRITEAGARRLRSLQLFGLSDLERVVFFDADMICTGDVRALFETDAEFMAAPDLAELERRLTPESSGMPYGRRLSYSFNSGVMSVGSRWLNQDVYLELLQLPGLADVAGAHELADQFVLNRYFEGSVAPLDPRYNFLIPAEALLRQQFGLVLTDARVLHFAGCPKPWDSCQDDEVQRVLPARFRRYYECWHELHTLQTEPLTAEKAMEEYRAGLTELSLAARARTQR